MSADRRYRLNRNAAEQLLRGEFASGPASQLADHYALASLLAVAAAPDADRELAGEAEAVTAFRKAHLGPATQPRRPLMSATRLLVAKAVIAVVGVSGGGFALAAATGHMPANLSGKPTAAGSAAVATARPAASGKSTSHPASSPSPSLRGLCQAYTAHAGRNTGKALDSPAFTALITAAGGKDSVTGFCTSLLATHPGTASTSHPAGKPSSHPAQANTAHPTGKPSVLPSGKPTTHP
jgi:hypothetical protein